MAWIAAPFELLFVGQLLTMALRIFLGMSLLRTYFQEYTLVPEQQITSAPFRTAPAFWLKDHGNWSDFVDLHFDDTSETAFLIPSEGLEACRKTTLPLFLPERLANLLLVDLAETAYTNLRRTKESESEDNMQHDTSPRSPYRHFSSILAFVYLCREGLLIFLGWLLSCIGLWYVKRVKLKLSQFVSSSSHRNHIQLVSLEDHPEGLLRANDSNTSTRRAQTIPPDPGGVDRAGKVWKTIRSSIYLVGFLSCTKQPTVEVLKFSRHPLKIAY